MPKLAASILTYENPSEMSRYVFLSPFLQMYSTSKESQLYWYKYNGAIEASEGHQIKFIFQGAELLRAIVHS